MALGLLGAALLGGGLGFGLGSMGGGGDGGVSYFDPKESKEARKWLLDLLEKGVPGIPKREVAGLTPTEQAAQARLGEYAVGGIPAAYGTARGEALKTATGGYADITKRPYFEPIVSRATREGDIATNRLARKLQFGGMLASSPGAKQLARIPERTAEAITARLAPYAEAERGRAFTALPLLKEFAEYEETSPLRRIAAVAQYGDLPRLIEQAQTDAEFNQIMQMIMFPYTTQAGLAGTILGHPTQAVYEPGGPTSLEQIMGGLGLGAQFASMIPTTAGSTAGIVGPGQMSMLQGQAQSWMNAPIFGG